ncbi:MAG: archease [Pseudomonadota bacterium]
MVVGFDYIEHTADIGVRVWGDDYKDLFSQAAGALLSTIVIVKKKKNPTITVSIELTGISYEDLLVKWLAELLFHFETRRLVFSDFWIDELTEKKLVATVKGIKFDNHLHKFGDIIKGVSYHNLEIKKTKDRLEATIVFDV